jgi:hypothetical protein
MVSTQDEAPVSLDAWFEQRLAAETACAQSLTLIMIQTAGSSNLDWLETVSKRLLIGDDWLTELEGGRIAVCLTQSGPESDPPIRSVMARIGRDQVLSYGIAHCPDDARNAQRLIDVATKRAQAVRLNRAA